MRRPSKSCGFFSSAKRAIAKSEVGGAVEVGDHDLGAEALVVAELDDAALGAAEHRAGDVEGGRELGAAGDHELRRQVDLAHVAVDVDLERVDHPLGHAADAVLEAVGGLGRGRELGAGDEQLLLEVEDVGGEVRPCRRLVLQRARATPSCEFASSIVP